MILLTFLFLAPGTVLATATVRIERPQVASEESWKDPEIRHRREVILRTNDGNPIARLRIIEHE